MLPYSRVEFPFQVPGVSSPVCVYRLFAEDSTLLYVGMTGMDLRQRLAAHRSRQAWWGKVTSCTAEGYATRAQARWAEYEAITQERPRYNVRTDIPAVSRNSFTEFERAAMEEAQGRMWAL